MQFRLDRFKNMPFSAKVGVSLWILSWIWLLVNYYSLTKDIDWVYKLSAGIGILAVFLIQSQNWARIISVLANIMGILLSGYFFLAGFVFVATVNVILFGSAIYYLMIPATSAYFKSQSSPNRPPDEK